MTNKRGAVILTNSSSDDSSKQKADRYVGLQLFSGGSSGGVDCSEEGVLGLRQHRHPHQVGVYVLERRNAEVEGAPGSKDGDHTQYEAGQLGRAGDEACADKAALLADPGEGDGAADARYSRGPHQQAEHGAVEALRVSVACGDAVEAEHRHVEEGQGHAGEEDVLVVVGHPAGPQGAQRLAHLVAAAALLWGPGLHHGGFNHQWLGGLLRTLAILQF